MLPQGWVIVPVIKILPVALLVINPQSNDLPVGLIIDNNPVLVPGAFLNASYPIEVTPVPTPLFLY